MYKYDLIVEQRDQKGELRAPPARVTGPHDLGLVAPCGEVEADLVELAPDPKDPDTVMLKLVLTDVCGSETSKKYGARR